MSENFNVFVKKFNQNWPRSIFYLLMSLVQWLSIIVQATSLIVPAIFLLLSSVFYALAALKHQQFQNSASIIDPSADDFPTQAVVREIL